MKEFFPLSGIRAIVTQVTSDTFTGGNRLPIVHRASTSCTAMSAYFQSLGAGARVRYQEKLT